MDTTAFEASLVAEGYEVSRKTIDANKVVDEHTHPFDARVLVVEGEMTITVDGVATRYGEGESCALAAGRPHTENVGGDGCTLLVGRRAIAGAA